jgi:hypothetical protein
VDDHSRFTVIASVVARTSSRAVCLAFAAVDGQGRMEVTCKDLVDWMAPQAGV